MKSGNRVLQLFYNIKYVKPLNIAHSAKKSIYFNQNVEKNYLVKFLTDFRTYKNYIKN